MNVVRRPSTSSSPAGSDRSTTAGRRDRRCRRASKPSTTGRRRRPGAARRRRRRASRQTPPGRGPRCATSTAASPSQTGGPLAGVGAKVRSIAGAAGRRRAGGDVDQHRAGELCQPVATSAPSGGDPGAVGRPRRVRPGRGAVGEPTAAGRSSPGRVGVDAATGRRPRRGPTRRGGPATTTSDRPSGDHRRAAVVERARRSPAAGGADAVGRGRRGRGGGRSTIQPDVVDAGDERGDPARRPVAVLGARLDLADPACTTPAASPSGDQSRPVMPSGDDGDRLGSPGPSIGSTSTDVAARRRPRRGCG